MFCVIFAITSWVLSLRADLDPALSSTSCVTLGRQWNLSTGGLGLMKTPTQPSTLFVPSPAS